MDVLRKNVMRSDDELARLHQALGDWLVSLEVLLETISDQAAYRDMAQALAAVRDLAQALTDEARRSSAESELIALDELRLALNATCLVEDGRWLVFESDLLALADWLNHLVVDAALPDR